MQFAKSDIDERHDNLEHSNGSNIEMSILIHRQRSGSELCARFYVHKLLRAQRKKGSSKSHLLMTFNHPETG